MLMNQCQSVSRLLVICLLILLAGCQTAPRRVAGFSVEGRPIEYETLGRGRERVLIMASIHGNEPAGTPLVHRLREYLQRHPQFLEGRRVILIPVANPDGYAYGTRYNVRRVDINRNFPAENFEPSRRFGPHPLSEPESQVLQEIIHRYKPDRIVSIHQPLQCVDYDGPATQLAQMMGKWSDLPIRRLGGRPGSLGSYAGDIHGIPIITLELPRAATEWSEDELWERYGMMLLASIRFPRARPL